MPRPRTPTRLLVLNGGMKRNPGRYAGRLNEPKPDGPIGDPPEWMNEAEAAAWREIAAEAPAGVLTNADRGPLSIAAGLRAMVRDGTADARDRALLLRLYGEFGMTPASRSKVQSVQPDRPEENEFATV